MEGTLDELVERVDCPKIKADLDVLHTQVTTLRISLEESAAR
jgi:hypothetical protein